MWSKHQFLCIGYPCPQRYCSRCFLNLAWSSSLSTVSQCHWGVSWCRRSTTFLTLSTHWPQMDMTISFPKQPNVWGDGISGSCIDTQHRVNAHINKWRESRKYNGVEFVTECSQRLHVISCKVTSQQLPCVNMLGERHSWLMICILKLHRLDTKLSENIQSQPFI